MKTAALVVALLLALGGAAVPLLYLWALSVLVRAAQH